MYFNNFEVHILLELENINGNSFSVCGSLPTGYLKIKNKCETKPLLQVCRLGEFSPLNMNEISY